MRFPLLFPVLLTAALCAGPAAAQRSTAPENAQVYFIWPSDGMVVRHAFWVRMGLRNMGVAPKGTDIAKTGHHHLLIDTDAPEPGVEIPNDRNHLHFGAGETETTIELPPGRHTLQLVMGDDQHVTFEPSVQSRTITITVK
jgi:hypothetical protein